MLLKFDIRGNLSPYKKVDLKLDEFQENFVSSFEESSSRHEIFKSYNEYLTDFKNEITPNFKQLINGSFTTNKVNPEDIDIVNLVDFNIVSEKYDLIKNKFINKEALKKYKIDAYLVKVYPKGHKSHFKTISDLLYWEHWFGHTKKNRAKKRFLKGFIELSFNQ